MAALRGDELVALYLLLEKLVKMTSPLRRVLALAEAAHLCPAQDPLDLLAHARGGFWFLAPDRLKHAQH